MHGSGDAVQAVLIANSATPTGAKFTMVDYRRLARPMRLDEWRVTLSTSPEYGEIRPFAEWPPGRREEFVMTGEPAWSDAERYVAPTTPIPDSPFIEPLRQVPYPNL
jgi:hypothetical protein